MNESFIIILVSGIVFLSVFGVIKLTCKPIKNITAILLTLVAIPTCGIALLIYKASNNTTYSSSPYSSKQFQSNDYDPISTSENTNDSSSESKKAARSYTDKFGKTTYYDENGDYMGEGFTNALGKTTYTDSSGNYAGESLNNGLGNTTYTDKSENVISSNTNYKGEETFEDGKTSTEDNFGNKYYH